jgi:soluble lytic murein transglycosylase-like protein
MKRRSIIFFCAGALLAVTATYAADSVVWFVDGRSLVVEAIHVEGEFATLRLAGAGQLIVPAARIERHHRDASAFVPAPEVVVQSEAWSRLAGPYAETIRLAARRHGLDPVLLTAMAEVESAFDPRAVSHKGAEGLLQLMPATARRFGVRDSFDPTQNVEGGAQYLKWLLGRFSGDEQLALAGYNAGEAAVARYNGIPPFPETERYVVKVLGRAENLRARGTVAR